MRSETASLKQHIALSNDLFEKLEILHNAFPGQTAYIVTCGPSLLQYDAIELKSFLSDKLVFSIKQAYQLLQNETDFHILHHSHIQRYSYPDKKTIVVNEDEGHSFVPADLLLPKDSSNLYASISLSRRFEEYRLDVNPVRPCGPGILYEVALYLALHIGAANVVIVGWDLYSSPEQLSELRQGRVSQTHFYEVNSRRYEESSARDQAITELSQRLRRFKDGEVINALGAIPVDDIVFTAVGSRFFAGWLESQGTRVYTTTDSPNVSRTIPRVDVFRTESDRYLAERWNLRSNPGVEYEFEHLQALKSASMTVTATDARLSVGWHGPEIWNGVPARWSGPSSRSVLPLPLDRSRDLEISVRVPSSVVDSLPSLSEGGNPIPLQWTPVEGGGYEGRGIIRAGAGWNEVFSLLDFQCDRMFCPAKAFPGSIDIRELGFAFSSCTVWPSR